MTKSTASRATAVIACLTIGFALAACAADEGTEVVNADGSESTAPATSDRPEDDESATGSSTDDSDNTDESDGTGGTGTEPATGDTDGESTDGTSLGGSDGEAVDAPLGNGQGAIGTIEVTITHPDLDPVSYTIGCLGDTFPVTPEVPGIDGLTACERLADPAVVERLVSGPTAGACTMIYGGPDVAVIAGEIDGQEVNASIDRKDGCGIGDWDDLLAGVLPAAEGVR